MLPSPFTVETREAEEIYGRARTVETKDAVDIYGDPRVSMVK